MRSPLCQTSMMVSLLSLVVVVFMLALVGSAKGEYDEAWCNAKKPVGGTAYDFPNEPRNIRILVELKDSNMAADYGPYTDLDFFFSEETQQARIIVNPQNSTVPITNSWALVQKDSMATVVEGSKRCEATTFEKDPVMQSFLSVKDGATGYVMGSPGEILQFGRGLKSQVLKESKFYEDRGMHVDVVSSCHYDQYGDDTYYSEFYFSKDVNTTMPSGTPKVVVKVTFTIERTDSDETASMDMVGYSEFTNPESKRQFEIPSGAVCMIPTSPKDVPMPNITDAFTMKVNKYSTWDYGNPDGEQHMDHSEIAFLQSNGIFVETTKRLDPDNGRVLVEKTVANYDTGLQFEIDETTGNCNPTVISDRHNHIFRHQDRTSKQMVSGGEFLYTKLGDYMYMGERTARGLYCDMFTGSDAESTYSWYFMTKSQKDDLTIPTELVIPVQLEVFWNADPKRYERYDIYQFNSDDFYRFTMPDIKICFPPEKMINLQFTLQGAYSALVTPDIPSFRRSIVMTLMTNMVFISPTRVAQVNFFPWTRFETMVQATVLDKLDIAGAQYGDDSPSAQQMYNSMKAAVDAGTVSVKIDRATGSHVVKVVKGSMGVFDPKAGVPTEPTQQPPYTGPPATDRHGQPLPTRHGGYPVSTDRHGQPLPTIHGGYPVSTDTHGDPIPTGNNLPQNNSDGYGPGDMAGLAIGMIIISVLATLAVGFYIFKFRLNRGSGDTIVMSKLNDA